MSITCRVHFVSSLGNKGSSSTRPAAGSWFRTHKIPPSRLDRKIELREGSTQVAKRASLFGRVSWTVWRRVLTRDAYGVLLHGLQLHPWTCQGVHQVQGRLSMGGQVGLEMAEGLWMAQQRCCLGQLLHSRPP